jgi:subtilisin family serine protease
MRSASATSLFSKHRVKVRRTLASALGALLLSGASLAWSGAIDPGLLQRMESGGAGQEYAVVIKLQDVIDLQALETKVKNMGRRERAATVVREVRARAEQARQNLQSYLNIRTAMGKIKKMTPLWIANGIAVTADGETITEAALRPDVAEVIPDRIVTLGTSAPASSTLPAGWNLDRIGVRSLWNAGYTGQGVVVANLDTGVDINHPELASKWRGGTNSWFDPNGEHPTPADVNGHGTQTMGIMVAGNTTDQLFGVAPGAQWIAAKIFNDAGQASYSFIHQAFQWVLDPDGDANTADAPDIVNCSWDLNSSITGTVYPEFRPDVQALTTAGIAVVFSAGNGGPAANTSVSPANYPESFSAGMTDGTDGVDPRSSRGPSAFDGTAIYPTVVAPGAGVTTTDLWFGSASLSTIMVNGTSFSAPHAAGAMALLLSGNPALTAGQMEDAIRQTAWDLGASGPDNEYGYGFLDVDRAARSLNLLPPAVAGDVNGNGALDLGDVLLVFRTAVGLEPSAVEALRAEAGADVFPPAMPDGTITAGDVLTLLRLYVGAP